MRGRSIIAALLFCALTANANATEYHWRVTSYLATAEKQCKERGGTPGAHDYSKLVRLIDVNDDGRDDFVVDYKHYRCDGVPNLFCSKDGFCLLDFLSWRSENEWMGFLHAEAADWRVRKGDKPALLLLQRQFCKHPKEPKCTLVYTFRKGAMSGTYRDAKYFRTTR